MFSRRDMLLGGAAAASLGGCALFAGRPGARLNETRVAPDEIVLTAQERHVAVGAEPAPLWLYNDWPFPVLRMKQGETLSVRLRNGLKEHTSIHWHGVRLPNAMDGVPYLTQLPVQPGDEFLYRFTPPDAGTFFFHPHCNTAEQLGRGLLGALIVEDPHEYFDDDAVLILKDWRMDERGQFLPFITDAGASKSGSFGELRTVNGVVAPRVDLKAGIARLRLINADPSRISEIGIDGGRAHVVAVDGNPVTTFALETWRLGPGMRLDLVLEASGEAKLLDYFAAEPVLLATLRADAHAPPFESVPVEPCDWSDAWQHTLELGAGVGGGVGEVATEVAPVILPDGRSIDIADSLCLAEGAFWTLDSKSWPGRDHAHLPPPLFTLKRGQRVMLDLANATSRAHPIHIHGHTMSVLSTSLLKRPPHRADTVLVMPNERVRIGFVADNPGNWMIHCHVIEHQETGMMGWFRVS